MTNQVTKYQACNCCALHQMASSQQGCLLIHEHPLEKLQALANRQQLNANHIHYLT
jgi:hypothetical protein